MMNIIEEMYREGFQRVIVLEGAACGIQSTRLILCLAFYEPNASEHLAQIREGVIHPYYPVSQNSHLKALRLIRAAEEHSCSLKLNTRILLKPILSRIPLFRRGKNTLSYLPDQGSRFHIEAFETDQSVPTTLTMHETQCPGDCGNCRICVEICPTHAIREDGFIKEKCLRFWMMNGRVPPDDIFQAMGNRLLGCDLCQSCCPMNRKGSADPALFPLKDLLRGDRIPELAALIGKNYALPNRVLIQTAVLAGTLKRKDLKESLMQLEHQTGSAAVRAASQKALLAMEL